VQPHIRQQDTIVGLDMKTGNFSFPLQQSYLINKDTILLAQHKLHSLRTRMSGGRPQGQCWARQIVLPHRVSGFSRGETFTRSYACLGRRRRHQQDTQKKARDRQTDHGAILPQFG